MKDEVLPMQSANESVDQVVQKVAQALRPAANVDRVVVRVEGVEEDGKVRLARLLSTL
jgi:hypothetical protein